VLDRVSPLLDRRFAMKYTKEQRLDIGRRIYYSEISRYEAAEEYGISEQTARNYMRMYRDVNRLPPKHGQRSIGALSFKKEPVELDELKSMTKEELIQELIKARITEARLKKGYEVKGDGTVILYASKTTK
jgi:transposase